jgi:hypothetical protein
MTDEPDLAGRLERAIMQQLARADTLRPSILQEVEREIGLGRAAFAQIADGAAARARSHEAMSTAETSTATRSAA